MFHIYFDKDIEEKYSDDTFDLKGLNEYQKKAFSEIKNEFKTKDTVLLHGITSSGKTEIYVRLIDEALKVGIGGKVSAMAGAQVDDRFAPPLKLEGTVTAIREGDRDAEVEAVVKIGSISVIVTKKRKPYHQVTDFTDLDLNPHETNIVVVKIGYFVPELYDMRKGWIMALTPGGVDQDLERLGYKNIKRPMFPLDADMENPDLSARLLRSSDKLK